MTLLPCVVEDVNQCFEIRKAIVDDSGSPHTTQVPLIVNPFWTVVREIAVSEVRSTHDLFHHVQGLERNLWKLQVANKPVFPLKPSERNTILPTGS